MKKILAFFTLTIVSVYIVVADPYSCNGSTTCTDGGCTASCSLTGSYEGATSCWVTSDTDSVTCTVKQGQLVIATTTSNCNCGGGGSAGTGNPDVCDPTQPLYWVYCDPFAL